MNTNFEDAICFSSKCDSYQTAKCPMLDYQFEVDLTKTELSKNWVVAYIKHGSRPFVFFKSEHIEIKFHALLERWEINRLTLQYTHLLLKISCISNPVFKPTRTLRFAFDEQFNLFNVVLHDEYVEGFDRYRSAIAVKNLSNEDEETFNDVRKYVSKTELGSMLLLVNNNTNNILRQTGPYFELKTQYRETFWENIMSTLLDFNFPKSLLIFALKQCLSDECNMIVTK